MRNDDLMGRDHAANPIGMTRTIRVAFRGPFVGRRDRVYEYVDLGTEDMPPSTKVRRVCSGGMLTLDDAQDLGVQDAMVDRNGTWVMARIETREEALQRQLDAALQELARLKGTAK